MDGSSNDVVIVGAGHAGGSVAAVLRQYGWKGPITLVGAEPIPPYQRPPLSKAWLKREARSPASRYGRGVLCRQRHNPAPVIPRHRHRRGTRSSRSVPASNCLRPPDPGNRCAAEDAVGARPRPRRGVRAAHVADADRCRRRWPGRRLMVIGAGYIGLEVAASARAIGVAVTVVEREHACWRGWPPSGCRLFSATLKRAAFASSSMRRRGNRRDGGHATGVRLADGRQIACDAVLVGIGATPDDALARSAGLTCADGIVVDLAAARTTDPRSTPSATAHVVRCRCTTTGRLESVPNALSRRSRHRPIYAVETAGARGAVVLVRPVRGPSTDRRPAVRRGRKRGPRGSRDWKIRHVPSGRERRRCRRSRRSMRPPSSWPGAR